MVLSLSISCVVCVYVQTLLEELIYFAMRYIPSLVVCLGCHAANLLTFCTVNQATPDTDVNTSSTLNHSYTDDDAKCHLAFGAV